MATPSADPVEGVRHPSRILIFAALFAAGLFYVVHSYARWHRLIHILLRLSLTDIFLVVLLSLLLILFQGLALGQIYRLLGRDRPPLYGVAMFLAMFTVNTVAPVAGLSGTAYLVVTEAKAGMPRPSGILLAILFYLTDYAVFLLVLAVGLIYLIYVGSLSRTILVSVSLLASVLVVVAAVTVFLFSHPSALRTLLHRTRRLTGRFLSEEQVEDLGTQANLAWKQVTHAPHYLFTAAGWIVLTHLSGLLLMAVCFASFLVHITLQRVLAGYLVGTLLYVVSVTPAGLGVAEGGMTAVFTGLGIPLEAAILVSLLYRSGVVLVPLLFGGPAIHQLPKLSGKAPEPV